MSLWEHETVRQRLALNFERLEVADGVLTLGLDYSSCVDGEKMSNWLSVYDGTFNLSAIHRYRVAKQEEEEELLEESHK